MTRAREWIRTFGDDATLRDLREALRAMAAELDDCDPEQCMHAEQRVHPFEVWEWIEREVQRERGRPVRFEPGYRPRRKDDEPPQWNLARVAG